MKRMLRHMKGRPHEWVGVFAVLCALIGSYSAMQQSDELAKDGRNRSTYAAKD